MARWFAKRGYRISMVTWDEGQQDGIEIDGVRVFKACRKDAGVKGMRFLWPRWTSLIAAMKRADADIYYQNGMGYETGQVAFWCHRHGRAFVYSVANDPDCDGQLSELHTLRERILYRYGLKTADRVIAQTKKQQKMLREGFGHDSVVIPMPCPGPSQVEYKAGEASRNGSQRVLWIGRVCEQKRPDRLLDLAEACPDLEIDFVGPAPDTEYARSVCERARNIENITVHGPASRDRVSELYRQARLMCCTSDFEGFPNTFLEAWSCGLPIVSTFDPDNLISEKGLGKVGRNVGDLAAGIHGLLNSLEAWQWASEAARQYYLANHTPEVCLPLFERLFLTL